MEDQVVADSIGFYSAISLARKENNKAFNKKRETLRKMTSQKVFLKSNFSSSMVKQKKEKEEKKFLSLHGSLQPRNPISHPMPVIQAVKRASEITSTGAITPSKRSCQTAGYNQCSNVKAATNRGFQVDGIHLTFCHDVLPIFFSPSFLCSHR